MQILAQQDPNEKDRFAVLGIGPIGDSLFYPWLIRANHGHGIILKWPRMFTRVTEDMARLMMDVTHQTDKNAIP
eukprot:10254808-Prorocentrum_lima.AAC.1